MLGRVWLLRASVRSLLLSRRAAPFMKVRRPAPFRKVRRPGLPVCLVSIFSTASLRDQSRCATCPLQLTVDQPCGTDGSRLCELLCVPASVAAHRVSLPVLVVTVCICLMVILTGSLCQAPAPELAAAGRPARACRVKGRARARAVGTLHTSGSVARVPGIPTVGYTVGSPWAGRHFICTRLFMLLH